MAKKGRPKNVRPHEVKMTLPKDADKYRAKRLYWALLEYEKKMVKDIASVKISDYNLLLSAYLDAVTVLNKKGIKYGHITAKERAYQRKLEEKSATSSTTGVGENRSSSVGTGIPAIDPLT